MAQNVEVGQTSRAEKTLRQRNKWRQLFDRGTLMAPPKFQTRILHFRPFGQEFWPRIHKNSVFYKQWK